MKKIKGIALRLMEGMGFFTSGINDRKDAFDTMEAEGWLEDLEEGGGKLICSPSDLKESVMFWCKNCEIFTMETPECCECMEGLKTRPRKTFIYYK